MVTESYSKHFILAGKNKTISDKNKLAYLHFPRGTMDSLGFTKLPQSLVILNLRVCGLKLIREYVTTHTALKIMTKHTHSVCENQQTLSLVQEYFERFVQLHVLIW